MNLMSLLAKRLEKQSPVRVGLIGAGKFGSMFLSQVQHIEGLEIAAIAELSPATARAACASTGWNEAMIAACRFTDDALSVCSADDVEVVVEATGNPLAGCMHALGAIEQGKHVVMVNVEADVLAGVALARRAASAGVVYSMAYGDQPALTAELVDWARASGFKVCAAGKGTQYLPEYHQLTPDQVWEHYGLTAEQAATAGMNPQMFNSFMDGTKSAIEMAAISNACDLGVPDEGLLFPPCSSNDLAHILRPKACGGVLQQSGMVEVVSSLERDGRSVPNDLRWGVYVVLEAPNDYAAACFQQYGLCTDSTGQYAAQFKPYHMIGLELSISVLNAALRHEPTGCARNFNADVVAVAKKDLAVGTRLDGEGGYTVWGKLQPAAHSIDIQALPIGLAHSVTLKQAVACGETLTYQHIDATASCVATQLRQETLNSAKQ